jgi:glycosyltransferase involved in cell wall biosynthesis
MNLNNLPLVSIITPVFNGERYLSQCIESVLNQDYLNIEYIVLDDGSNDKTREILKKYIGKLSWESHANMGQALTLNKGWAMSKGHILSYLSADDILLPTAISKLVKLLLENPKNVVAYPNCHLINFHNKVIKKAVARIFDLEQLVITQKCYIGPGVLFKREVFEKIGGWKSNIQLCPDGEFWMRVGLLGRFVMHPEVLAHYRIHLYSTSYSKSTLDVANDFQKAIESFYKSNDIPGSLLEKKHIALANAHVISSQIHLRAGRFNLSLSELKLAKVINPKIKFIKIIFIFSRITLGRIVRWFIWHASHFSTNNDL